MLSRLLALAVRCALAAGCLIGLSGCFLPVHSPDTTITFHADRRFTEKERECVQDSAAQWTKQTQGLVNFGFKYDYNPKDIGDVVAHNSDDTLVRWTHDMSEVTDKEKERDVAGAWLLGLTSQTTPIAERDTPLEIRLVADRLTDYHVCKLTVMHEFGHSLGLPHWDHHNGNIMFHSILDRRTECLKSEDLLMFCAINDCGYYQMKPCAEQPELDK